MSDDNATPLERALPEMIEHFTQVHRAREAGLAACRKLIQASARAIRAVHRGEFATSASILAEARTAADAALVPLRQFGDVYYAGFVRDAEKEYAEACTTLALAQGKPLPSASEVGVDFIAYLNGLGDTVGELRRLILDRLRAGQFDGCEELLAAMDDIYAAMVTVDFPDAITGGLRRTTDQARGILERTRGDLTMAIVQRNLGAAGRD